MNKNSLVEFLLVQQKTHLLRFGAARVVRVRYGLILATLRQGCSPLDDLPQDYSRGNAPRFHWRVSPAPISLSLSLSRLFLFCLLSPRFALSLYHPPRSILLLLSRNFLPSAILCLSLIRCRKDSFLLPSVFLSTFLPRMPCLSFIFCLAFFSLFRKLFFSSHNFLLFLTVLFCPSFLYPSLSFNHAFFSCSIFLFDSHYPSLARKSKAPGGGILTPHGACALHVQLPSSLISSSQLFDARGKDLRVAYFVKIDRSLIK